MSNDFYLRYYVGHKGKFGHEFLEFEFRPDGKLRSVVPCLPNGSCSLGSNPASLKNQEYHNNVSVTLEAIGNKKKSTIW